MELRDYQKRAIERVRQSWARGNRAILVVAPTGSGKTVMFSEIARSAISKGGRVLVLAHRKELVEQAAGKLQALGLDVGIVKAGVPGRPNASVQVASTQTLLARSDDVSIVGSSLPPASMVLVDEAHHYPHEDTEWGSIVAAYKGATIIGFTATPERGDGQGMSQFKDLIVVAQPLELIAQGHLVPVEVYRPVGATSSLAMDPVDGYQRFANANGEMRKAIIFAGKIKFGEKIVERLRKSDVPSAMITQNTTTETRSYIMHRFRHGQLRALCGVHVLTEGLDVPDIYLAILCTKCGSPGSLIQRCGRVMRPAPGKTKCVVLDLMGATLDHGLPDDNRQYSLMGNAISVNRSGMSQCPCCGLVDRSSIREDRMCPGCGFYIKGKKDPAIVAKEIELAKEQRAARCPDAMVIFIEDMVNRALRGGWKKGQMAVRAAFKSKFKFWPSNALVKRAGGWRGLP